MQALNANGNCGVYEGWAEWRDIKAAGIATIYLELGFHDTYCDALWLQSDDVCRNIAQAIADALDKNRKNN